MVKRVLFLFILATLAACDLSDLRYGFAESCFKLSQESRLPKWMELPYGYSRDQVRLTFCYYIPPFIKPRVIAKIIDAKSGRVLEKKYGFFRYHPRSQDRDMTEYPIYTIITVDGVEDVFEHRQLGDVVHIAN